nr:MAG TPA: hypothetical protein [Caudoviricetes sp.]
MAISGDAKSVTASSREARGQKSPPQPPLTISSA